mmetsp:Transcript_71716/g.112179  ORF Transcript_71716/g.112179 Transcript_71716/m.112179 type:complete len:634 (+) Transcript_71716:78-1979(+)
MNVAHDVGHSHYAEYPQPASMIAYGHNGHSSPRSSRSGRSHSRKKPSLFEKLCFGNSGYAEKVDSHDNNLDHERHGTRAVHSEDLNPMHSVYHSDAPSHHAQNYSPMHGGSHTMDAHPPWSRVHPSMQTHYEPVAMPHQIGLLSTFQQSPSLNMWQRPSSVPALRAPSMPLLPSVTSIHGQFTQSAPSRQLSRPTSQLGSPVGSVSIPVATTPPPPLGVVPGGWPAIQEPAAVTLQATPHAPIEPVAASIEQRKQMFEQSLRQQFDLENRRIQEITIAQKEVVRQRALEQKANIDRQAAAAMGNLDRRGAEQVVGLQRAAYSQHSQLEMQAAQAQAVNQLHHLARNGVDVRMHAAPTVMQFSQLPPPPMTIPTQAVPIATAGLDTNHDGRPNVMVTGPDMNRDGIPDSLQQPSVASIPTATVAVDANCDGRANYLYTGADMNRDGIPDALQGSGILGSRTAFPDVLQGSGVFPSRSAVSDAYQGSTVLPARTVVQTQTYQQSLSPRAITPSRINSTPTKGPVELVANQTGISNATNYGLRLHSATPRWSVQETDEGQPLSPRFEGPAFSEVISPRSQASASWRVNQAPPMSLTSSVQSITSGYSPSPSTQHFPEMPQGSGSLLLTQPRFGAAS